MYFFSKRFFPFFNTFFWGAFNDNVFRYALSIMIVYQCDFSSEQASALTFTATALLMCPQFFFSSLAGEAGDKYEQKFLFKSIKLFEVFLMLCTLPALYMQNVWLLLLLLFLTGIQSAFFSPLKYSYIYRNDPEKLLKGNSYICAGTYVAILAGMIAGILLIKVPYGNILTGLCLLTVSGIGYYSALKIPEKVPAQANLKLNWNLFTGVYRLVKILFSSKTRILCVAGYSFFWMTGALYVSQLAGFCKYILGSTESLVILLTLLFSFGVASGAWLCSRFRGQKILYTITPALLLMAVFTLDLYFTSRTWTLPPGETLYDIMEMLKIPLFWRITADLYFTALFGGFYSIPLASLLQSTSKQEEI